MKKLNQLVLASSFVLLTSLSFAQGDTKKDENRIMLTAWVPEQIESMPVTARKNLENKLTQLVVKNGLGGSPYNTRFIVSANITVATKDILPGPPPMHAMNLDVTLYIGDGFEGTVFSSTTISVKGVGTNETKAYMAGLKNINPNNPELQGFVEKGKQKIIQYYKDNCDLIIKKANSIADQSDYEQAIFMLASVPSACEECYVKSMNAIKPIYKKKIDKDCKEKLQQATGIWNAAQDMAAAEQAGAMLASVDPDASCIAEVKALANKIAAKVKQIDDREWKYIVKDQQQESERIQAIRDIGVAYGNGPKANVTYKSLW
ncbi:MAG: hypothetical protein COX70_07995 [Flavobacteriales bacterium CG_4_10_14_0_2_um_filter_32_8]|nr:MAG: hypothetical protein COX70_07995 [Flavobacteriales bacterium CG_4_10_14_0_2_um_filter_32_8]